MIQIRKNYKAKIIIKPPNLKYAQPPLPISLDPSLTPLSIIVRLNLGHFTINPSIRFQIHRQRNQPPYQPCKIQIIKAISHKVCTFGGFWEWWELLSVKVEFFRVWKPQISLKINEWRLGDWEFFIRIWHRWSLGFCR